mgnify:CR=1 FL=1
MESEVFDKFSETIITFSFSEEFRVRLDILRVLPPRNRRERLLLSDFGAVSASTKGSFSINIELSLDFESASWKNSIVLSSDSNFISF